MPVGLLDTSVVIDWDDPTVASALPDEAAICAITLAELTAGPHLASSGDERARRQARRQQVEATFDAIAFDAPAARSYGQFVVALSHLGLLPLVDLGLRLGEGSGALRALPLVQAAARALGEMATFDAAGVTDSSC